MSGIEICSMTNRKLFDDPINNCDLEYGALEKIPSRSQLMVYKHDRFWYCMDTLRDLEYLNKLSTQAKPPWKVWEF